jgi:hypothetical protein
MIVVTLLFLRIGAVCSQRLLARRFGGRSEVEQTNHVRTKKLCHFIPHYNYNPTGCFFGLAMCDPSCHTEC